jgi:hypothetical protein
MYDTGKKKGIDREILDWFGHQRLREEEAVVGRQGRGGSRGSRLQAGESASLASSEGKRGGRRRW